MNRRPVSSSNIAAVGYDEATKTLEVEFSSGSVYQYADVPKVAHRALVSAESIGSYFNREIRSSYTATKIG